LTFLKGLNACVLTFSKGFSITPVHWFKSQGLFLDRNKALMEWRKTGMDSGKTLPESEQTGMESM
jgi:hypothetical protein